jgi:hypothetical protein
MLFMINYNSFMLLYFFDFFYNLILTLNVIPDILIFQVQETDRTIHDGSIISVLCCNPANESTEQRVLEEEEIDPNPPNGDQLEIELCHGDAQSIDDVAFQRV